MTDLVTSIKLTLCRLKDSDVGWLYGPIQPGVSKIYCTQTGPSGASLFQPNSLFHINRKPILKKRSVSDIVLQRLLSIPPSSQQATPIAQARLKDRRRLKVLSFDCAVTTDNTIFPFSSTPMSRDKSSMLPSLATTGISTPAVERKHIHFNYKVEQCMAVEVKGDDDDDISTDTNSEDGILIKLDRPQKPAKEGNSLLSDRKTIVMLPSTTLRHREHILGVPETAIYYTSSVLYSHLVSPFSPQETARPLKALGRFFEDSMDVDIDSAWYSSESLEEHDLHCITSTDSLNAEPTGKHRTPSDMFMPYDEAVTCSNKGMLCRIIDTVKTARDMAYVIWNSG
jgi:hypothetical protein